MKTLFLLVLVVGISLSAIAAKPLIPKGKNIALGKKYTTNIMTTKKWEKSLKVLPDYEKILTDGAIAKSRSGSFWVSPHCSNFTGAGNVDVIIDLGQEMPVSGIFSRHGARPTAGVCFPRKEEYFVSDDRVKFYKVGEFKNSFDDYSLKNQLQIKKTFKKGIKLYGVDNLKTKGRYIMIRTYGSDIGNFPTYVGYDEIFVIKGKFALSQAVRINKEFISLKKIDLPADLLGYRINPLDWKRIVKKQPMFLALGPMQFIGDNEYHLSVGGTYVMPFVPIINTKKKISNISLKCELPASIKLISYNNSSKLTASTPVKKHGKDYIKYSFSILKPDLFVKAYMYYPYLVVQSKTKIPGKAGKAYYSYSYKIGAKKYNSSNAFDIIIDPEINGKAPKRFLTGFWMPYQARFLENSAKATDEIVDFYSSLGFNCLNGGNRSKDSFAACKKNRITVYGGSGFNNGMMLSGIKVPVDERFIYNSKTKRKNIIGVCPTLMYNSSKYAKILKEKFTETLKEADHIYSNWEPYMFIKQGCVCERCKKEFQKFASLSDVESAKKWPDCVIDKEDDIHNRFSSYQYAEIIKLAQKLTREAGVDLKLKHKPNFMIAYEPSFVDPDKSWFKTHSHNLFYKDIDMSIMWSYPNSMKLSAFDLKRIPGNSLAKLPRAFANATKIVNESGRKAGSERFPKILFMGTEYGMKTSLVMPKDYYFMSLLCFFSGLDGYGTWCTYFKLDARYVALNAKANTLISKLENIVMDGKKLSNAKIKIVSPVPEKIGDKKVALATVKAFEYQNRELVAIGNDHIADIYVKLQVSGLTGKNYYLYDYANGKVYQKSSSSGYSASDLAKGVIIPVEAKSWSALMFKTRALSVNKKMMNSSAAVKKQLRKDTPKLKSIIAELL
ncbi:MAG: hypothetical protein L3J71_11850 [Victivallaceae bacterium]|nr:hypothetical protein [Victivallaceae bacterium]